METGTMALREFLLAWLVSCAIAAAVLVSALVGLPR